MSERSVEHATIRRRAQLRRRAGEGVLRRYDTPAPREQGIGSLLDALAAELRNAI